MDDKENNNPFEELQKQLQEALKNANISFAFKKKSEEEKPVVTGVNEDESIEPVHSNKEALRRIKDFNFKPREVRDYLNRFVIKQSEAKKVLSVAICDHYNHIRQCIENPELLKNEYSKQNIILLGPTGVGKTYLMRNIAKLIGVPFVKADATKFSETGYIGSDVEDLVRDLVKAANGDAELAQYGIIYIDEIDKIAGDTSSLGRDVSGRGVQINLLKLMEDSDVNLLTPTDMMAQMQAVFDMTQKGEKKKGTLSTRHILFIVSGAFDQLAEVVKKRVGKSGIGFGSALTTKESDMDNYLKESSTIDFIRYGFEPEFIGRLPVRVACSSLNQDDLARILKSSEGSILKQYHADFNGYNITFDINEESIQEIAYLASLEKTGARGLLTVLERLFRDFKFELPSTAIKSFDVTADTIENPKDSLKQLLLNNKHLQEKVLKEDILRFIEHFKKQYGLILKFDNKAKEALIAEAIEHDRTIRSMCEVKFKDFQYGLKIISRNIGQIEFKITPSLLKNPDKELSKWVVDSFKKKGEKKLKKEKE